MTDYPSIKPEDVREGDVVRARFDAAQWPATIEGVVHYSLTNDEDYRLYVGGYVVSGATDLRLVSMGRCCTPPEPPLRVGDWVRDNILHREGQITETLSNGHYEVRVDRLRVFDAASLTRIEPPVGWPVGVPDPDAPGGVEWYQCTGGDEYYVGSCSGVLSWADLLAAGGVPAQAVTR